MLEPLPESNILLLVARFEDMLSKDDSQYFDSEELEDIIEYYSEKSKWKKALAAVKTAMKQFPFNMDFQLQKVNILITLEKYEQAIGKLLRPYFDLYKKDNNISDYVWPQTFQMEHTRFKRSKREKFDC